MAELLLEVFSEEIPARMQARAAADLKRLVEVALKKAELGFDSARAFVTPRRLCLVIDGLPLAQEDSREERRGPKADAPEKAIAGFLRGAGVTLAQCETRETPKGVFLFAVIERNGRATIDVLSEVFPTALADLPWPKSMRWGTGETRWVRPIHAILTIFDGQVVPFEFAGIASGNETQGHRFHAPEAFAVTDFADYKNKLEAAKVMLDADARRLKIEQEARRLALGKGVELRPDDGLLAELCGLVEWPVPFIGEIDQRFMTLPDEVLVASMRGHQKYLCTQDETGALTPYFIGVANIEATDGGVKILAGNRYVLTARLSDAEFFWNTDRNNDFDTWLDNLGAMTFHAKLGHMRFKAQRLQDLCTYLADRIEGVELQAVQQAGLYAKADLVSQMVGEFPELQGVMGGKYYSARNQEQLQTAQAIAEHYAPRGPDDVCPNAPDAVTVALADKIDSLVGFWSVGEKPTGSGDPLALRRAALGVIRLIIENNLRLPLLALFEQAVAGYQQNGELVDFEPDNDALLEFFADRLKVHLRGQGLRHDLISAVFALGSEDDLVRLIARVEALRDFVSSEDGGNLLTAYRRAANILRIEEKKDGVRFDQPVNSAQLAEAAEKDLYEKLEAARRLADVALVSEDFSAAMAALAALRGPVDSFFDDVTVNADDADLRVNRLRLLSAIRTTLHNVADFSKIEG